MTTISNLKQLEELVATAAFCPKPPLSERRAIHESGAWRWVGYFPDWCDVCRNKRNPCASHYVEPHWVEPHWEPAPFATDPSASYALEQRMRELGFRWRMVEAVTADYDVCLIRRDTGGAVGWSEHSDRRIAVALASLRALGVEFTLQPGWDKL